MDPFNCVPSSRIHLPILIYLRSRPHHVDYRKQILEQHPFLSSYFRKSSSLGPVFFGTLQFAQVGLIPGKYEEVRGSILAENIFIHFPNWICIKSFIQFVRSYSGVERITYIIIIISLTDQIWIETTK